MFSGTHTRHTFFRFKWIYNLYLQWLTINTSIIFFYHVESNRASNFAAGTLSANLVYQSESEKSIEINWSPASADCIQVISGFWIRLYESGTDPSSKPYLSIPRKCLKPKQHLSGREALSILLPSSNSSDAECNFVIQTLVICRSYQVEVVPDYQSLRGKTNKAEIIVPPTVCMQTIPKKLL